MSAISAAPYLIASAGCVLLARIDDGRPLDRPLQRQRRAWVAMSSIVGALGFLRPYEIHAPISDAFRSSALAGGWYGDRVYPQVDLLVGGSFLAGLIAIFLLFETRHWHLATRLAALVTLFLFALFVLRIVSLHAVDAVFNRSLFGVRLAWAADVPALALLVGAAALFRKSRDRRQSARDGGT